MRYNVYEIKFTDKSQEQFLAFSKKQQKQIGKKIDFIGRNPMCGKPLQGPFKGLFSYRLGTLRIIYRIEKQEVVIIIVSISHRKHSYRLR